MLTTVLCCDRGVLRLKLKDAWCMAGCGLISIFFFNVCYFHTMQHTQVNVAVVLLYTSPVFISILARLFFKDAFGLRQVISLILVVVGCLLVSGTLRHGGTVTPGVLATGLTSGLFYGLFSIFGRCAQNRGYGSMAITFWSFAFASLGSLFFMNWELIPQLADARQYKQTLPTIAGLVGISTILPYYSYTAGLKNSRHPSPP